MKNSRKKTLQRLSRILKASKLRRRPEGNLKRRQIHGKDIKRRAEISTQTCWESSSGAYSTESDTFLRLSIESKIVINCKWQLTSSENGLTSIKSTTGTISALLRSNPCSLAKMKANYPLSRLQGLFFVISWTTRSTFASWLQKKPRRNH